jgi:NADH dehydrogenase FAD-containing subunit
MTISKNLLIWLFSSIKFTVAAAPRTIYKDVVILGGGASGAHAAVRLREDYNKSIIIIEKQDNLVHFSFGPHLPRPRTVLSSFSLLFQDFLEHEIDVLCREVMLRHT